MDWLSITILIACVAAFCFFVWKRPGGGLILMPFLMAVIIFTGSIRENIPVICLGILLFPITILLVRLTPTAGRLETPWYKTFASIVLTIFNYLFLLAAMILVFRYLGPVLFVLFVVGVIRYKMTHRYSLALDILSAIGMSMRQSLPLPMALNAAAQGQKRRQARIFTDIAYWLTQGWPLAESLRRGYPKCPPELLASIAAAEKMNQLPQAIDTLQEDIAEKVNDCKRVRPVHPWYPVLVIVAAFFIIMGLAIFIVPTFSQVLSDMSDGQARLPASTQALLDFSRFISARKGLNALLMTLAILGISLYFLSNSFRKRNPQSMRTINKIEDWIKWHLPLLHWFERTYSHLQLTELLKVALRAGYPVNTTLRHALGLDVNNCFRGRMNEWLIRIERGEYIADSALRCGFDRTFVWAFDNKINKGNTVEILESLEDVYRSRYSYRSNLLNAIGCPLMVLGLGLLIGSVVYAMFMGAFSILFATLQYTMP